MLKVLFLLFHLYHFSLSLYFLNIDQSLEISQTTLWNYIELNTTDIQDDYLSISLLIKYKPFQSFPLLTLNFDHFSQFLNYNNFSVNSNFSDFYSYENQMTQHSIILKAETIMGRQNVYVGVAYPNYKNGLIKYQLKFVQSNGYLCDSNCSGYGKCNSLDLCLCNANYVSRNCGIHPSNIYLNKSTQIQVENDKIGYFEADLNDCNSHIGKENSVTINCTYIGESGTIFIGKPTNNTYDLPNSQNYLNSISFNSSSISKSLSFGVDISEEKLLYLAVFNNLANSKRRTLISCQLLKKSENSKSSSMEKVVIIAIICSLSSVSLAILILCVNRRLSRAQVRDAGQRAMSGINMNVVQTACPVKALKDIRNKSKEFKVCVICLEDMTPNTGARKMMCGHIFHSFCIDEWFLHHKCCCVCKRDCESPELVASRECDHNIAEDARFVTDHSIEPGFNDINSNVYMTS